MNPSALRFLSLLAATLALAACVRVNVYGDPNLAPASMPDTLRIASYNVSLYSDEAGGLVRRLQAGDDGARRVAAVLQRVRPDIVLLNEFDYVADGSAADLFQQRYLGQPQPGGGQALHYPYRYLAPVNTGAAGHFSAQARAASRSGTSSTKRPASCSFESANGPS